MKKSTKPSQGRAVQKRSRWFGLAVFASVLLAVGMITALARYESARTELKRSEAPNAGSPKTGSKFVTVEIAGRRVQVNAQTMQQGPLTQDQAQQIAAALKDNTSTDGLVQIQNEDGSISMDLQGRFQDVVLARKNDDGSVAQGCVDNSAAAGSFLQTGDSTSQSGAGTNRKAAVKE
jgi:hypothetical protein